MRHLSPLARGAFTAAALIVIVLSTVSGALAVQPSPAAVEPNPPLRVNAGSYPNTLDPQLASYVYEIGHLKLLYEGLTRLDTNLNTQPAAAASWSYNTDATELTFTLRSGLTYSDGSVLNAKRFVYSILRALDPALDTAYGSLLDYIVGAQAYRTANIATDDLVALKAAVQVAAYTTGDVICSGYDQLNCLKLVLKFSNPTPYFHTVMSLMVVFPAKQELIETGSGLLGSLWWRDPLYQVGNGPFMMVNMVPSISSLYAPNLHYWRGAPGYAVQYNYFVSAQDGLNAYIANALDIIPNSANIAAQVAANPTLSSQTHTYASSCTFGVMYHHATPPFDNQKIREAFAYAINRQAWVNVIMGGGGAPTLTWIPPGEPGYDAAEDRWGYNPTAALAALAASGYTVNAAGKLVNAAQQVVEIVDTFPNSPNNLIRHTWLANQWYTVLGVVVTLNPVQNPSMDSMHLKLLGWCADYPDPQNWLSVYWNSASSFAQRNAYSSPTLDAMLDIADATIDPTLRIQRYIDAQDYLISGAPAIFLYNSVNSYLVKPRVIGELGSTEDALWMGIMDPLTITLDPAWYLINLPVITK